MCPTVTRNKKNKHYFLPLFFADKKIERGIKIGTVFGSGLFDGVTGYFVFSQ